MTECKHTADLHDATTESHAWKSRPARLFLQNKEWVSVFLSLGTWVRPLELKESVTLQTVFLFHWLETVSQSKWKRPHRWNQCYRGKVLLVKATG